MEVRISALGYEAREAGFPQQFLPCRISLFDYVGRQNPLPRLFWTFFNTLRSIAFCIPSDAIFPRGTITATAWFHGHELPFWGEHLLLIGNNFDNNYNKLTFRWRYISKILLHFLLHKLQAGAHYLSWNLVVWRSFNDLVSSGNRPPCKVHSEDWAFWHGFRLARDDHIEGKKCLLPKIYISFLCSAWNVLCSRVLV